VKSVFRPNFSSAKGLAKGSQKLVTHCRCRVSVFCLTHS